MASPTKSCSVCGRQYQGDEGFCAFDGTPLPGGPGESARRDPLVGLMLDGRYRILRVIGEGGMGIVYEAEHVVIEKRVAIKVLRQDFTRKPEVVARFRQEARSASRIGHPNIIDVIDFGNTPFGSSYFVMEKLEGEDLAEVLAREFVLSPSRAVHLVHQCCRALAAAHQKGIFHRDLKPENLFLVRTESGFEQVKVVDFGVAKMSEPGNAEQGARRLTRTGMLFGTPEYMSPEQAKGVSLDHRADIYALGIILYELVTGRVPFEGENFMEVLNKHAEAAVPPMERSNSRVRVSDSLRAVIMRALEKDRDKRFQSMDEMARALEAVVEMPSPSMGHVPPPWALSAPVAAPELSADAFSASLRTQWLPRGRWLSWSGKIGLALGAAAAAAALGLVVLGEPNANEAQVISVTALEQSAAAQPKDLEPHDQVHEAQALTRVQGAAEPDSQPQVIPEPHEAPSIDSAAEPQLVTVELSSLPAGARVEVDDVGTLCEATPCSAGLIANSSVLLRFVTDDMRSSARVTPERNGQRVHVNLLRRAENAKETTNKPGASSSVHAANDLKVPAAFR